MKKIVLLVYLLTISFLPTLEAKINSALVEAIKECDLEKLQKLVADGADLEAKNRDGETALVQVINSFSTEAKMKPIVEYLLSLKVNTEAHNKEKHTALMIAAKRDLCEVIKTLVLAGANLEARNKEKKTALFIAIENNNQKAAETLLGLGAQFDIRDELSLTPLMQATLKNQESTVKYLLFLNADFKKKTKNSLTGTKSSGYLLPTKVLVPIGSTALDIARQFDCKEAERALVDHIVSKK